MTLCYASTLILKLISAYNTILRIKVKIIHIFTFNYFFAYLTACLIITYFKLFDILIACCLYSLFQIICCLNYLLSLLPAVLTTCFKLFALFILVIFYISNAPSSVSMTFIIFKSAPVCASI